MDKLKISEFAKVSTLTRRSLLYYDMIGILKPHCIDAANGYRYYSLDQLPLASAITILKDAEFSKQEIQQFIAHRNPETTKKLLENQVSSYEEKIQRLLKNKDILSRRLSMLRAAEAGPLGEIESTEREEVPIILGNLIPAVSGNRALWENMLSFIRFCSDLQIPNTYPIGIQVHIDQAAGSCRPSRFFFQPLDASLYQTNSSIPKGSYLRLVDKCLFGQTEKLYNKLLAYAAQQHQTVVGAAYEQYLVDELALAEGQPLVLEILCQVQE